MLFRSRGGDLMEVHIRKEPPQEGLVLEPGKIGFDLGIFTKKCQLIILLAMETKKTNSNQ